MYQPELILPHSEPKLVLPIAETLFASDAATFRKTFLNTCEHVFERGVMIDTELKTQFLTQLVDFLDQDPNHARLLLYLPFELLPNIADILTLPTEQAIVYKRFANQVEEIFLRLLHESDVRAAYTNGDVLEPGMGEPERVRKIGHLTPWLLEKGLVSLDFVLLILEITEDQELIQSLLEGLWVARGKNVLTETEWQSIVQQNWQGLSLLSVEKLHEVSKSTPPTSPTMSSARKRWIAQITLENQVESLAERLLQDIAAGNITPSNWSNFETDQYEHDVWLKAIVRAIQLLGDTFTQHSSEKARMFAQDWLPALTNIQTMVTKNGVWEQISSCLGHWFHLGLIDQATLDQFGVFVPNLADLLPVPPDQILGSTKKEAIQTIQMIENDPDLNSALYPVLLFFGSRVKGYANGDADYDFALLFKPETQWEQREAVLARLKSLNPWLATHDAFLEFWLGEINGQLTIKPVGGRAPTVVGAPQIHFIFGGYWYGDPKLIAQITPQLTDRYTHLAECTSKTEKQELCRQLLRQLETDALQLRLLHKGYRKWYPNTKPIAPKYGNFIDWDSDFYDPGYRKIATQLFLSKVFLPDLSEETKLSQAID